MALRTRAERRGARILPIFVEPCEIASHPELASFQALNSPTKPLAEVPRVEAERVLVKAVPPPYGYISWRTCSVPRSSGLSPSICPAGSDTYWT